MRTVYQLGLDGWRTVRGLLVRPHRAPARSVPRRQPPTTHPELLLHGYPRTGRSQNAPTTAFPSSFEGQQLATNHSCPKEQAHTCAAARSRFSLTERYFRLSLLKGDQKETRPCPRQCRSTR